MFVGYVDIMADGSCTCAPDFLVVGIIYFVRHSNGVSDKILFLHGSGERPEHSHNLWGK